MSSFMVPPETMNRVVNAIMEKRNRVHSTYLAFGGVDLTAPNAEPRVAAALYAMNQAALKQRYPDTHDKGGYSDIPEYRFQWVRGDSKLQRQVSALKAMHCLIYQCAEGTVPETGLYQDLETFADDLAKEIVCSLPEYERADWG